MLTRKRSPGCAGVSRPIQIGLSCIFISPPRWLCSARSIRHEPPRKRGLRSTQALLSAASAPSARVTIRPFSRAACASLGACAWRGCQRANVRLGSRLCENSREQSARRIVFSLFFSQLSASELSFPIKDIRDKLFTRKSDVGVFTQPGSKGEILGGVDVFRFGPQQRTSLNRVGMSVRCQQQTHAPQQFDSLPRRRVTRQRA
jgi:hypothetical protein